MPPEEYSPRTIRRDDPLARATVDVIVGGDLDGLKRLLDENPWLAVVRIGDAYDTQAPTESRTLLHVATDWPGHFPNAAATVALLVDAGADVNARFAGLHTETPLHWAASTDDVEVLEMLLDRGADIEAPGAVIGGGTALADAVAFGQWGAARRLVERGARTNLWQAAALGLMDRVQQDFSRSPLPTADEITTAFWCACHGGQRAAAEYLLSRDAAINWIGFDDLTPLDAASRSGDHELARWLRARGARSSDDLP